MQEDLVAVKTVGEGVVEGGGGWWKVGAQVGGKR